MGCIWFGVCWRSVSVWLWWCGIFMQSEALLHTEDGRINVRNMLRIEYNNNKTSGIKLVSLYSTIKPRVFDAVNFVYSDQCLSVYYPNQTHSTVRLVGIINKYISHIPYLLISSIAGNITLLFLFNFFPACRKTKQFMDLFSWRAWGWPTRSKHVVLTYIPFYTGLFKMIAGVLTTCHTQYTWDRSICVILFNRTTLQVFVTYFQVLYMCILCGSTNINTIIEFVPICL